VLVALVLLIACTNVGNLLTAQAASRAHEMALRISIGAGKWRLIQLVLVESSLLATIASVLGTFFASRSIPWVVSMLHVPEDPVRLVLDSGWRGSLFTMALASSVALLFGLGPALRASAVRPIAALKGTEDGKPSYRQWLNGVLAAQMAFCVLVLFLAGLFVSTFQHLTHRPLGFTAAHVLDMDCAASKKEPIQVWMQAADRLRSTPGVQSVALAGWPLLSRNRWTTDVRVPGRNVEAHSAYVLDVSPGFFARMHIAMIGGRDFWLGDRFSGTVRPLRRVGIVNEAFARAYIDGRNPIGRSIDIPSKDLPSPVESVGYVHDAVYYDVRETIHPTIYVPMEERDFNTFLIRTVGDPLGLAPTLRRIVPKVRSDFKVHTVQSQSAFLRWQMLRERLLAALSFFFAVIALALAAIGLFGLLNYSVTRQRREIGICVALGARPSHVVHRVTSGLLSMVSLGLFVGLVIGVVCGRVVQSLLFEVRITDPGTMVGPLTILLGVALLAALPATFRAIRIDPAQTLRND